MASIFRNLIKENQHENTIKQLLIHTLNENVKEIQYEFKEHGKDHFELIHCTNSLCTTLEAIYLHGLKDSLLWETMNVISGGDVDRRPEPNFWPVLLAFLHKQVIEQIQSLSQISTEIGYCRSWIRLSLNDSLLSSYLNNMKKDISTLKSYYKQYALLRDADSIEIISKILESVEACVELNLPTNSSLLNRWTNDPLQLAGIWSPPLKSCPIMSGFDVAGSMTNIITIPTPKPVQIDELFPESISNSPFRSSSMITRKIIDKEIINNSVSNVNECLEISLQNSNNSENIITKNDIESHNNELRNDNNEQSISAININLFNTNNENNLQIISLEEKDSNISIDSSVKLNDDTLIENSVMNLSIKTDHNEEIDIQKNDDNNKMNKSNTEDNVAMISKASVIEKEQEINLNRSNSMTISTNSLILSNDTCSYNSLLVRHERTKKLDWNDVWIRFEKCFGKTKNINVTDDDDDIENNEKDNIGFEIISQNISEKFTIEELQSLVKMMFQSRREESLDAQNFICKSCSHLINKESSAANLCAFSGYRYCDSCIHPEPFLIPAKIIYNWDFEKYSVSKYVALFLMEFQNQPFIDIKLINPDIYKASDDMAILQSLRIKLNFIRAYLFTCRESIFDELLKQIWPKEYLYEHIHLYSIADLAMIEKGTLKELLQKTVTFGKDHILNCQLCSVKGFICEICKSSKVLYPFNIETTFRCEVCGAVFHADCLNDSQPCPKCERKKRWEDSPLHEI